MAHFRRIMVPFDHLQVLETTLAPACALAAAFSAEVLLVRVESKDAEARPLDEERLFSEFRGLCSQMQERSFAVYLEMLPGPPEESLLTFAENENVDLIVLSSERALGLPTVALPAPPPKKQAFLLIT
jgi:nucleotide-binding universal stress UspA family protein